MKIGDRVDIEAPKWLRDREDIGPVFTGTILQISTGGIQIKGATYLGRPPREGDVIPCRRCSRPLTDPAWQSIGFGQDCALIMGLSNKVIKDIRRALTPDEIVAARRAMIKTIWFPKLTVAIKPHGSVAAEEAERLQQERKAERSLVKSESKAVAANMRHEEISDAPFELALPFDCVPRGYQWRAARHMIQVAEDLGVGPGLWDLMGTGKTICALLFMMLASRALQERGYGRTPCVVVCPPVMALTWKRTIEQWWQGARVQSLKGWSAKVDPKADVFIMPWSILASGWQPRLDSHGNVVTTEVKQKDGVTKRKPVPDMNKVQISGTALSVMALHPRVFVGDESHSMKNPSAQRSMAAKQIVLPAEYVTMMTGTAVLNRVNELIPQLDALGILEKEFGGTDQFEKDFANKTLVWQPTRGGGRRKVFKYLPIKGAQLVELHRRLIPYIIRRKTEDVIKDMPPLTISRVMVELANRREYEDLEEQIAMADPTQRMGMLAKLRQLGGIGKIPSVIEWIENFLECDEKLVVFGVHRSVQRAFLDHFSKWKPAAILGQMEGGSQAKNQKEMDRFQTDPDCLLAICSSGVGGVGITLTAATNLLDVELDWVPGIQAQRWKRIHRFGQTHPCTVWCLAAEDSYDDTLLGKLATKRIIAGEILDGEGEILSEDVIRAAVVRDLVLRVARRKKRKKAA